MNGEAKARSEVVKRPGRKKSPSAKKQRSSEKQAPKDLPKKGVLWTVSWTLLMLVWVGASVIASQYVVGYAMLWILGREQIASPVPTAILSGLSYVLAMALIIYLPPKVAMKWQLQHKGKEVQGKSAPHPASRAEIGLTGLPTWTDIGLAPIGYVVYFLLAAGLVAIFSQFTWFDAGEAQDVGFSLYISGIDRVVAFIALVVVAPVAEEIIFRGWLYGKLRNRLGKELSGAWGIVLATFLVSLLFGLVHMQWNVGVNVFALSIVLCALREVTGTIYAGILLHMLKNGVAFYLLYVMGLG